MHGYLILAGILLVMVVLVVLVLSMFKINAQEGGE